MISPSPWGKRLPLLLVTIGCVLPLLLAEQRPTAPVSRSHLIQPQFRDWSTRHTLYSRSGTLAALEAVRRDPRAEFRWWEADQRAIAERQARFSRVQPDVLRSLRAPWRIGRVGPGRFPSRASAGVNRDWAINLGTAGTAAGMSPTKFSFDVSATPSCGNDFVVFPINAVGGTTQANLVAFNNLYSGTAGGTGFCNRTASGSDNGTAATVLWSYNVHAIAAGAGVPTSPVLSQDGKKVAFVESAAGNPAHFHVLAWNSLDGQDATNLQNARKPLAITSFASTAPSTGAATDVALGAGPDTLSSPFIDYRSDMAYVGNDAGVVFRIKNVFCILPSCSAAAPSLDSAWGIGGALTIGGTCTGTSGKLTAPVLDQVTMNLYVGCADGKLYSISQAGVVKNLAVGDGLAVSSYGAIVDPPLVDSLNGFVYVVTGSASNKTKAVIEQAKTDLTSPRVATIGGGNLCNMHSPTPNNAYFTSITSAGSLMYVGGLSTTGSVTQPCSATSTGAATIRLYGVTFGAGGAMSTTSPPGNNFNGGSGPGLEWAQLVEFFNPTTNTDWLFGSAFQSGQTNVAGWNVTTAFPGSFTNLAREGVGTSGMVVDNAANTTTFGQAASVYFNALQQNAGCNNNTNGGGTGGCAVKLTQAGLQ
jgi:hypothetical protein